MARFGDEMKANRLIEEDMSASLAMAPNLEFSGERIVPGKTAEALFREHEERYVLAGHYVSGKEVLDVACGTGVGTEFLRSAGARRIWGLDIDPGAIAYAQSRYAECEFAECEATNLCLSDESVDVVVSFETLEHLTDQRKFLGECWRVLRPGGMLICSTPNTTIYRWQGTNPYHVHELSTREFEDLLGSYFCELHLLSQTEQIYPVFVLKRIASRVLQRLKVKEAIKGILGMRAPCRCMRDEFSAEGAATCGVLPYRRAWLVRPTYLIAVVRKMCLESEIKGLGFSQG
jgi:ubiquinone/menaquinone biosynthesis C-methylase UbiE